MHLSILIFIELFFILFGQTVTSILVKHVKSYVSSTNRNHNDNENFIDQLEKETEAKTTTSSITGNWSVISIFVGFIFALGFSRICMHAANVQVSLNFALVPRSN